MNHYNIIKNKIARLIQKSGKRGEKKPHRLSQMEIDSRNPVNPEKAEALAQDTFNNEIDIFAQTEDLAPMAEQKIIDTQKMDHDLGLEPEQKKVLGQIPKRSLRFLANSSARSKGIDMDKTELMDNAEMQAHWKMGFAQKEPKTNLAQGESKSADDLNMEKAMMENNAEMQIAMAGVGMAQKELPKAKNDIVEKAELQNIIGMAQLENAGGKKILA